MYYTFTISVTSRLVTTQINAKARQQSPRKKKRVFPAIADIRTEYEMRTFPGFLGFVTVYSHLH